MAEVWEMDQMSDWYNHYLGSLSMDDDLWHQSLVAARHNQQRFGGVNALPPTDRNLLYLFNLGLYDPDDSDGKWAAAIRGMRYAGVIGERLWSLIEMERARVRLLGIKLRIVLTF